MITIPLITITNTSGLDDPTVIYYTEEGANVKGTTGGSDSWLKYTADAEL